MRTEQARRVREAMSHEVQRDAYPRRSRGLVAAPSVDEDVAIVRGLLNVVGSPYVGRHAKPEAIAALDRLVARIPTATKPDSSEALSEAVEIMREARGHYGIEEAAGPGQPATEWDEIAQRMQLFVWRWDDQACTAKPDPPEAA
jgi:hypothetical protein